MRAGDVYFVQVHRHDEDFFFFRTSFGEDFAGGSGDEALAPEFDTIASKPFVTDSIGHGDVAAIGDGVGALDRFPGGVLAFALSIFFLGMPADGSRIKRISAPCMAVRRAASGYHWSQQTRTPIFA